MRQIPAALAERLAAGATTLAHVMLLKRRDGQAAAFTDHDRPLAFDGLACEPVNGVKIGVIEKGAGLDVDTASIAGALASEALGEADLARGLWDGARVDLFRVDWSEPALRVHLFAGRLGEVRRGASAFEAELRGLQAPLNAAVGRVYSRHCDADLGDARCTIDLDAPAYRGAGEIVAVLGAAAFRASGLAAFADGWFARGRIEWAAGGETEVAGHRLLDGDAAIELADAPAALAPGAQFVIRAGCDKSFATCAAKFANRLNFRGFPHMPGNDALQAGPEAGRPLDGGSRFI